MKPISSVLLLTALSYLMTLSIAQSINSLEIARDPVGSITCYKRSIYRATGFPPSECPQGMEKSLSMCYEKCKEGYQGQGSLCIQNCPEGYSEKTLHCFKKITDWFVRKTFGRGLGRSAISCPPNHEMQNGLCYPICDAGYFGQGPTCWQKCKGPTSIDCGTMCASNAFGCQRKTNNNMDYVYRLASRIGQLAGNIEGVSSMSDSNKRAMEELFGTARTAVNQGISMQDYVKLMQLNSVMTNSGVSRITLEEIFRMALLGSEPDWKQLAQLDPTGAADLILAFNNRECPE
jgi:hypothetical protein